MELTLVVGERVPAELVAQALRERNLPARAWNPPDEGGVDGSSQGLATALVAFETALAADPPGMVLLADGSDAALAAALVATKLLVPVEALKDVAAESGVNARLISQLAATYTPSR